MKKLVLKNSGIPGFRTSKAGNENNWFAKKSVQFENAVFDFADLGEGNDFWFKL